MMVLVMIQALGGCSSSNDNNEAIYLSTPSPPPPAVVLQEEGEDAELRVRLYLTFILAGRQRVLYSPSAAG